MTITAPTITVGEPDKRPLLDFGTVEEQGYAALHYEAALPAATPSESSRHVLAGRLLSAFALGLTLSALSTVGFEIVGSDDGVFISALAAGGFLSLSLTAGLRWYSGGYI